MSTIPERIATTQQRITNIAHKVNRLAETVTLMAVSKTKPASDVAQAYAAGQRHFGENYVQEGQEKVLALATSCPEICWHFIGPLQSNKSRVVAEHFDWMHTVDREKIALRLNEQRPAHLAPLNVCIQVNVSQEQSKSGVQLTEVIALAKTIHQLPQLKLRGLMAIPTAHASDDIQQRELRALQGCFGALQCEYPEVDTLSVGMSDDLEAAIAHGSTMVRIGSAIFGARDYSDKDSNKSSDKSSTHN